MSPPTWLYWPAAYTPPGETVVASGGTVHDEGGYRYHIFKSSGTFTVTTGGTVEILLVAGGGSGSRTTSADSPPTGGGGGGVLLHSASKFTIGGQTNPDPISVTNGDYEITVGAGGGARTAFQAGINGQNSRFLRSGVIDLVAVGGGQGNVSGSVTGGSGGGKTTVYGGAAGPGTPGQGYNATKNDSSSGAGATATNVVGGGPGISVWGTLGSNAPGAYAGGGGGFQRNGTTGNPGGFGGGGAASSGLGVVATSGTANTGGGGGGGLDANSGAGGSGIVIIRYPLSVMQQLWTPLTFSTTRCWWTTKNLFLNNGEQVNFWNCLISGRAWSRNSSVSNEPSFVSTSLNGSPAISFPGGATLCGMALQHTTSQWGSARAAENVLMAAVITPATAATTTQQIWLFDNPNGNHALEWGRQASKFSAFWWPGSTAGTYSSTTFTAPGSYIVVGFWDKAAGTRTIWVNSGSTATTTGLSTSVTWDDTPFMLLATNNYSQNFNGTMHELVLITSPETNTREILEGYLAHQWGLQSSLPVGHPYKTTAPVV